jgi:hypothetical protein
MTLILVIMSLMMFSMTIITICIQERVISNSGRLTQ